jgi:hypothetical protein
MFDYVSPFEVQDNIQRWGKAYAFWAMRDNIGTIRALYMIWVALHMIKHEDEAQRNHAEYRYQQL